MTKFLVTVEFWVDAVDFNHAIEQASNTSISRTNIKEIWTDHPMPQCPNCGEPVEKEITKP